jgi:hypothetical protein
MAIRFAGMLLVVASFAFAKPAWLPAAGCWGKVSLNTVSDVKGDFPPKFPASRNVESSLFTDYTGGIYNPYDGASGCYVVHGGGHQQYLGNEVYQWSLDDRMWHRASDPTYPGEVDLSDWTSYKEPPYTSALLNNYGELATNVPASNHSRRDTAEAGPKGPWSSVSFRPSIRAATASRPRRTALISRPGPGPASATTWGSEAIPTANGPRATIPRSASCGGAAPSSSSARRPREATGST